MCIYLFPHLIFATHWEKKLFKKETFINSNDCTKQTQIIIQLVVKGDIKHYRTLLIVMLSLSFRVVACRCWRITPNSPIMEPSRIIVEVLCTLVVLASQTSSKFKQLIGRLLTVALSRPISKTIVNIIAYSRMSLITSRSSSCQL